MKKLLFVLWAVLCLNIGKAQVLVEPTITVDEALEIAKQYFPDQDVDYYLYTPTSSGVALSMYWQIFVDCEPMKGWEHACCIMKIPTKKSTGGIVTSPQMSNYTVPPAGNYTALSVTNRYGDNATVKPLVKMNVNANGDNSAATRTYAVIISGGIRPQANYERYWNDCSFIYQTLTKKYGVPKGNIYPLMSDGNNPAADMMKSTGSVVSQSLDLDFDGQNEISLSATKANVQQVLNTLSGKMKADDHLFVYVIDHGGKNTDHSYICLWNNESLYDNELASMLDPIIAKSVNVNVVLGQCYSGGFVKHLQKSGCVVAAASKDTEPSWSCRNIPYDEFVYHWTCAVNGANHLGVAVNADTDNNGFVTMDEAFKYARRNDTMNETPQYGSTPLSIGEDLAFDRINEAVDLYIMDNAPDTGKEPNLTTPAFWMSPSIWIRNKRDGVYQHENPIFTDEHPLAYIYVRVHNRGKADYVADNDGRFMHVYWAKASTIIDQKTWKGRELYNNTYITGDHLTAQKIPNIPAGEYRDMVFLWPYSELAYNDVTGEFHYCLLAKIMDSHVDDGYVDGKVYFDLSASNDQAQKNVTIVTKESLSKEFFVYVRNTQSQAGNYSLELVPATIYDGKFFNSNNVELGMSPKVYQAWTRGGSQGEGISLIGQVNGFNKFLLNKTNSKFKSVKLNKNEFDLVSVKFNFKSSIGQNSSYSFNLIQKDESGKIIGGETFIVEAPGLIEHPIEITSSQSDNHTVLSVENDEFADISWYSGNDELMGHGSSVVVGNPTKEEKMITAVALTEDGDLASESVIVERTCGIESATEQSDGNIEVSLLGNAGANARIVITQFSQSAIIRNDSVQQGTKSVIIDASGWQSGIYTATYYENDEAVNSVKFEKR